MCDLDLDQPSVFRLQTLRARKSRRCCECGMPIPVGERYVYVFGVWDGSPDVFAMHLACAGLRQLVVWGLCGNEGEIPFGGLVEEISMSDQEGEPYMEVLREIQRKYEVTDG